MNSYGQIHDILYTLQYKESSNDRKKILYCPNWHPCLIKSGLRQLLTWFIIAAPKFNKKKYLKSTTQNTFNLDSVQNILSHNFWTYIVLLLLSSLLHWFVIFCVVISPCFHKKLNQFWNMDLSLQHLNSKVNPKGNLKFLTKLLITNAMTQS